ncbi:MAG: hypothetical protein AAB225_06185 [Acidobacteriota bacterium]
MTKGAARFFEILYLWGSAKCKKPPESLMAVNRWVVVREGLPRWSRVTLDQLHAAHIETADLIILNADDPLPRVNEALRMVRSRSANVPVLVIDRIDMRPATRAALESRERVVVLEEGALAGDGGVAKVFEGWEIEPPPNRTSLGDARQHPEIEELVERLGDARLARMIRVYFPEESHPRITPVSGGWSEETLVRVTARDHGRWKEYYVKFFADSEKFKGEIMNHRRAREWLGDGTVGLRPVPGLASDPESQLWAFPRQGDYSAYPVCYESASQQSKHVTLKELYSSPGEVGDPGEAFCRLFELLRRNQTQVDDSCPPWSASDPAELLFFGSRMKAQILGALRELASYGKVAYPKWDECDKRLRDLVYRPVSGWLAETAPVIKAHVHGDPNPRNCLVDPQTPQKLILIDCGGYQRGGRAVLDLALIERDIKLVLMATEGSVGGFRDLDPKHLRSWSAAERQSIGRGLKYSQTDADSIADESVKRAYRLVALVREQARKVTPPGDSAGKHYFAALLHCTLKILKELVVPQTKKLLALYSAAEILGRF